MSPVRSLLVFISLACLQPVLAVDLSLPPLLAEPTVVFKAETFPEGKDNDTWYFLEWWEAYDGILVRNDLPGENKRIFIKKPEYKDVAIRFDFQFRGAEEIRLVTGGGGHYNFGVHIRRNRFRVKTADDKSVPYFPTILGECPFNFEKGKWYTMQVEVVGEEILARLDAKHFVVGKHPMLARKREYFAFQVDQSGAAFDNVGIWHARAKNSWRSAGQSLVKKQFTRPWTNRNPEEELKDLKMITMDRVYRTDAKYRAVVAHHEELQAAAKKKYPAAYKSSKEGKKEVAKLRTKLRQENSAYKESVNAINKAKRREVDYLEGKVKGLEESLANQYRAALEKARLEGMKKDAAFRGLVAKREELEKGLQKAYPQLNVTNEDVVGGRRKAHARLRETDPAFVKLQNEIGKVSRARSDYLLTAEPHLAELEKLVKERKKK
jgi:hypothetical protein